MTQTHTHRHTRENKQRTSLTRALTPTDRRTGDERTDTNHSHPDTHSSKQREGGAGRQANAKVGRSICISERDRGEGERRG
mmetsp:Transcript_19509/g.55909  ORF Transcript_19509/g.55909 Transcript_19509/m.55909 type:complete len:81 (+) Transcript_19509:1084-1326(+)